MPAYSGTARATFARSAMTSTNDCSNHRFHWRHVAPAKNFNDGKPQQVQIDNKKYAVWRQADTFYAIDDACSHQGASLSLGQASLSDDGSLSCKITCPYHAIGFSGETGRMIENPHGPIKDLSAYHLNAYKTLEKNGQLFLHTAPVKLGDEQLNSTTEPYMEPESLDPSYAVVELTSEFAQTAKVVLANSLDLLHTPYVHSFGNAQQSLPIAQIGPEKVAGNDNHWHVNYTYVPGDNSSFKQRFNADTIQVNNDFILPDTIMTRISFGDLKVAIVNRVTPMTDEKCRMQTNFYQNFSSTALPKPIATLLKPVLDMALQRSVKKIVEEDRRVIESIDPKRPMFFIQPVEKLQSIFSAKFDRYSPVKCSLRSASDRQLQASSYGDAAPASAFNSLLFDKQTTAISAQQLHDRLQNCLVERLDLVEQLNDGKPRMVLNHISTGEPVGHCQVFNSDDKKMVTISMTFSPMPTLNIDSHMLFIFTEPQSLVPHFTLDAVKTGPNFAFHLDMLPKVPLDNHQDYAKCVYEPLSNCLQSANDNQELEPAHLSQQQLDIMSPSMIAKRATQASFDTVSKDHVQTYLDHWLSLVDNPDQLKTDSMTNEDVAHYSMQQKSKIFDPQIDPVWQNIAKIVGEPVCEEMRSILKSD